MKSVVALLLAASASALRVPTTQVIGRRAAVSGLISLPAAVSAAGNPLVGGDFSGYKQRDYGNGYNTAPGSTGGGAAPKAACPEGQRLAPDGFGGKTCKGAIKTPIGATG